MKLSIALGAGVASSIFVLGLPLANAATETVVYSFCGQNACADGSNPASPLIDINGKLYGTASGGGQFGQGTLFKFDPKTGSETVLYSFGSADDGVTANGLLNDNGTLYGTTDAGGTYDKGTVFSFDLKTNTETVLHSFGSSGDGANPEMVVPIQWKGVLYGTTAWGGAYGVGTVFSIDPQSGTETVLHSFQNNGVDGWGPWTGLTAAHGMLYGVTDSGGTLIDCGANGCGTVYSVNPQNGDETVRYSFTNEGGNNTPFASLLSSKGLLYGTTQTWAFSFDPDTNVETVLKGSGDAGGSYGALTNMHGTLYGTTPDGGENSCSRQTKCGDVFSVDLKTGTGGIVYSFQDNGSDGNTPYAGLVEVKGALYGTTTSGGTYNGGTIFKITP